MNGSAKNEIRITGWKYMIEISETVFQLLVLGSIFGLGCGIYGLFTLVEKLSVLRESNT